jgi:HK97 family phage major capsid protein
MRLGVIAEVRPSEKRAVPPQGGGTGRIFEKKRTRTMSQTRLSAIRQEMARLNEQAQPFRRTIADARKTAQERKDARAAFDKLDFGGDGHSYETPAAGTLAALSNERDQIIADNEREARGSQFDRELSSTDRPRHDDPGAGRGADRSTAIQIYDRALQRHGVVVTKRGGQLHFKNLGLENVHSDVRATIEDLNRRYFDSLKRYWMAFLLGDTNRCSADDREIVFGRHEEFRGFLTEPQLSDAEKRDMGIGTLTLGGYFVPKGFVYDVEEALKYYGPMLLTSEIMDTATGQPLPYPTDNDTTVMGELVGEGQQVTEKDVLIGQVLFGAWKFSSKMVKLSLELMQDSAFDMETYIKRKLAIRIGRIYNNQFTLGTGVNAPNGIVTAVVAACGTPSATPWTGANNGYGIPLIASGAAANDGGAETGGTSIGSQDLDNLEHTVDPLYRRGAGYMMHDQTLRRVKVLLDKYGRPLWKPGVATGDPDEINGYEYFINNDMAICPAVAQNPASVTALFGALDKYVIRRVKELGIITLRERFADYGQLGLIGFSRADGQLLDAGTHPICYLIQANA